MCVQKTVERMRGDLSKACLEHSRRYGPSRIAIPLLARSVSPCIFRHIVCSSDAYMSCIIRLGKANIGKAEKDGFSASITLIRLETD